MDSSAHSLDSRIGLATLGKGFCETGEIGERSGKSLFGFNNTKNRSSVVLTGLTGLKKPFP